MTRINFVVAILVAILGLASEAQAITKNVKVDCGDGRVFSAEVECNIGQFVNVTNRCDPVRPTLFKVECNPDQDSVYFAVGASGVYLLGTTLDSGGFMGEANFDLAVPFGKLRWLQFLAQASFGGGDGMFSGSSSVGLGFVLNGDPDERAGGSTRLGLLASLRGIGDGDSQDLLDIGGKLEFEVSMGRVMSTQWNWFLGVEGGGSIYTDENDVNQNDGWYLTTVTGFTIRL